MQIIYLISSLVRYLPFVLDWNNSAAHSSITWAAGMCSNPVKSWCRYKCKESCNEFSAKLYQLLVIQFFAPFISIYICSMDKQLLLMHKGQKSKIYWNPLLGPIILCSGIFAPLCDTVGNFEICSM